MVSPCILRFEAHLKELGLSSVEDLRSLDRASESQQAMVLDYLAGLAFSAQNVTNISLGREGFKMVPKEWLLSRWDRVVAPHLATHDEWEYRRVAELLKELDEGTLKNHLRICAAHVNKDIQEIASEDTRAP